MKVAAGYIFPELADKKLWYSGAGNGSGNIGETMSVDKLDPGLLDYLAGGNTRLSKGSLANDRGIPLSIVSDIEARLFRLVLLRTWMRMKLQVKIVMASLSDNMTSSIIHKH
jgi:hypothetical protein